MMSIVWHVTPCGLSLFKKVLEKPVAPIFIMIIWETDVFIQCTVHSVSQVSNFIKIRQVKAQLMHAERRKYGQARRSRRFL